MIKMKQEFIKCERCGISRESNIKGCPECKLMLISPLLYLTFFILMSPIIVFALILNIFVRLFKGVFA